jgi:putative aldouronate transport system permease protein
MSSKYKIRRSTGDMVFDVINYTLLVLVLIIVIYPLWFVVIASFSDSRAVLNGEVWLWPKDFQVDAYVRVFKDSRIMRGYANTIFYTLAGTTLNIIGTVIAAYPLSRKDFVGRNVIMMLLAFTMYFSGGLIPTYLIYRQLHIVNTVWVMILPGMVSVYNLIIVRTFFQGIPFELQEAAFIDGANNFAILTKVIVPLSKPVLAVMVIFYGVGHWNEFFNALVFLSKKELAPLQLVMRDILITASAGISEGTGGAAIADKLRLAESLKYSVIIVSSLPVLMLYPFLQKYFVKGVMLGAIKG